MTRFWRNKRSDDGVSNGDTRQKGMKVQVDFPVTMPFWMIGVLLAILLMLLWLSDNPEVLTGFKASMFTKETVSSTTTGEFQLASDLYTARSHVCDVLLYQDGKREMTMILRYHVNVLYDMKQVSIRVIQDPTGGDEGTGSSPTTIDGMETQNPDNANIPGKRIEVRLPDETIEVVTEKYAGLTGQIADGELPGIEIFDKKGTFQPKEDDHLADAFLSLYNVKSGQSSISRLLKEEGTLADKYLPYTSMLVENQFSSDLNQPVQDKMLNVVAEARSSVVSGLGGYYEAIGYDEVVVLDAKGNQIAQ